MRLEMKTHPENKQQHKNKFFYEKTTRHLNKNYRRYSAFCAASAMLIMLILLNGCAAYSLGLRPVSCSPVVPPRGYIYHHYTAPLILPGTTKVEDTTTNPAARFNLAGLKIKKPEQIIYVKIPYANIDVAVKRSDIEYAIHQAGIKEIVYADYEYFYLFGYFKNFTIHAYGYKE